MGKIVSIHFQSFDSLSHIAEKQPMPPSYHEVYPQHPSAPVISGESPVHHVQPTTNPGWNPQMNQHAHYPAMAQPQVHHQALQQHAHQPQAYSQQATQQQSKLICQQHESPINDWIF